MKILQEEKKTVNPIRRTINYVIVPIYLATTAAALITGGCLMAVDEKRYTAVFLILCGFVGLLTAALLALLPFLRKKEAIAEAEKYDLDLESVEQKDKYEFEHRVLAGVTEINNSPFETKDKTICVTGNAKLKETLSSLRANGLTYAEIPADLDFFISDTSCEGEFSHYEIEVSDSGEVQIFEKSNLVFCSDYAYVNGKKYSYDSFTATVNSVRVLNQVQLSVIFEFGDYLCATARLDKNVLAILKRFPVKVTNDGALKLLLTDKLNAFTQILKYGKIKNY